MLRLFLTAMVVLIAWPAPAQEVRTAGPDFGRYHALVIGNNDYQHLPKLSTAVGDAEAVAEVLAEKYGFRVTKILNARRKDITGAFNKLRQELTENDNLLVYYAGHGVLDIEADEGYWQPVDARRDDDSDWFPNTRITRYLKAMSAKHVMVVADSCYSGNLTRAGTSTLRSGAERRAWIERMNDKRSRTAMTSGGLEPVLDRGGGDHSVFAQAFLATLRENDGVLIGEELFDQVKVQVVSNADQTPGYSDIRYTDHERGDFLLVPTNINITVTVEPPAVSAKPDPAAFELSFWQSIQNSDDPAMFLEYLKQYPDGRFAGIARLKAKIDKPQTALTVPAKPAVEAEESPKRTALTTVPKGGPPDRLECDRLAASPLDPNRKAPGVAFEDLEAVLAIDACQAAVRAFPDVARFEAQLARSLDKGDRLTDAVAWYRKAAEHGITYAQVELGRMYTDGFGTKQDHDEALKWFRKAAAVDDAPGQLWLGYMYAEGRGVGRDDREAVAWFRKAAGQAHPEAQHWLGVMYLNGDGVEQDDAEALKWFRKAADQDDVEGLFSLGMMYEEGYGVAKDNEAAARWYRRAKDQGHEEAEAALQRVKKK